MDSIFKNTPLDVLIQILEYDGRIKYKKGEFINIIHKKDERYSVLQHLTSFKPVYLYEQDNFQGILPLWYIKDLGKYFVKLQIIQQKYRYIFQRKREENDTSVIILFHYKLV